MSISPVSHARASHITEQPAPSSGTPRARITPQQVSPAVLKAATGDGDGLTGAAALNDGDAAASRAAQQVKGQLVDIKA